MKRSMHRAFVALNFVGLVASLCGATYAKASTDTYVSATGVDSSDCQIAAPCATLRRALAQTAPGGTVTILTSGRYGPVDVRRAVHIMADGVSAVVDGLGACNAPICVDAGPNDVVTLHGLTINVPLPYKANTSGVMFTAGAALHVDHCLIGHLATSGIIFYPQSFARLHVFDSKVTAGAEAIEMGAVGAGFQAVLDGVEVHESNSAVTFQGTGTGPVQGFVRNSLISSQFGIAVWLATDGDAVPVSVMIDHSVLANGQNGVRAESSPNTIVRIGETTVTGEDTSAILSTGGTIASYGDNRFVDGVDGIPASTVIPLK